MDAAPSEAQVISFSTDSYRAAERVGAWRELFGRTVLGVDVDPIDADGFSARATVTRLPGFGAIRAVTSAVRQNNSSALIANDDITFGGATAPFGASQAGRCVELRPGDGLLMSNGDIGSITLASACRLTVFCVPRSTLAPLVRDLDDALARRIPAGNPGVRMLFRYLKLALGERPRATPEPASANVSHVVDLLALAIGANRDAAELARSRGVRAARLEAMKQDIHEGLKRPDLSARLIAARHGVTPRYVQALFDGSGTTFTRFVLERRLAAARDALANRARAHLAISAIAYESGFADLSNFNRAFRRRFGCTPTDVRAAALAIDGSG